MSGATTRRLGATLLAVAALVGTGRAEAAEIKVLSAGAVRSIVTELAQAFEKETGHKVSLAFGTVGVTRQRLVAEPCGRRHHERRRHRRVHQAGPHRRRQPHRYRPHRHGRGHP